MPKPAPIALLERLSTGIPNLDIILNGGFFRRSIYLLTGTAGTGKTVLANQICFNHVASGGQAVYITLLAETHGHLFANLQSLAFFSKKPIGKTLHYFSGAGNLKNDGVDGFLELITQILREYHPTLLVFDTLSLAQTLEGSTFDFERFINKLSVYMEVNNATALLLSHPGKVDEVDFRNTLVDGVIRLNNTPIGQRSTRTLEVYKLRGSRHLEGAHRFRIDETGVLIYPRTEARFNPTTPPETEAYSKKQFGIEQLDAMLHGGLVSNSTTMLLGVPGTGKTLLGTQFLLAGAAQGEPGLYFGFHEPARQLIAKTERIGLNLRDYVKNNAIEFLWQSPLEDILDVAAERLIEAVQRRKVQRVVIDSVAGFHKAIDYAERFENFFIALTRQLQTLGTTVLFCVEMRNIFGPSVDLPYESTAAISDNILFLRYVELHSQLYRLMSILKMRDSDYEGAIREFKITATGIQVAKTFESAQAILTGLAQPLATNSAGSPKKQKKRG